MLKKVALLAFAGAALASTGASATTSTSNLTVQAQISGSCTLSTPNTIDFATQSSTLTQIDIAPVNIVVNCSSGVPFNVGMNSGANPNGSQRRMFDGAGVPTASDYLIYDIFVDSGRTQTYLNNSPGLLNGTGTGSAVNLPVYPSILAQTTPVAGTFTDTVIVTLNY